MSESNLLNLLHLSDLTLPIGSYAHSSGLETYVQLGIVHNLQSAREYITAVLLFNLRYNDAAFVSLAYDAAEKNDWESLVLLDDQCTAGKLPRETREASQKLGIRMLKTFQSLCDDPLLSRYKTAIHDGVINGNHAISFGLIASALGICKEDALTGFCYNACSGMVTNSVKLIPLGQQDGQELLYSLQAVLRQLVKDTMVPDFSMLGFSCPALEIRCMQHEQLYSRLYMS